MLDYNKGIDIFGMKYCRSSCIVKQFSKVFVNLSQFEKFHMEQKLIILVFLDIDECLPGGSNNCTDEQERCNNTIGGFECICDAPVYRGTNPNCGACQ